MPRGIPNDPSTARQRGGWHVVTKEDLRQRMREIEQRIKQMDRREKAFGDLKRWLLARKLEPTDLMWMIRQMKPKRADAPVKSKKPLQPPVRPDGLPRKMKLKGDPAFMKAIREARIEKGLKFEDVGPKVGVSGASVANWEQGRYVPREEARVKLVKFFGLPADLGAEATQRMIASQGAHRANGRAASP